MTDLTGMRFGRWIVLEPAPEVGTRGKRWACQCDCGTLRTLAGYVLRYGRSESCGCIAKEKSLTWMVGKRYGRLVVLSRTEGLSHPGGQTATRWLCKCDCGNTTTVATGSLSKGTTRSCGCLHKEMMSTRQSLDLKDRRFGHLVAIEYTHTKNGQRMWRCTCDCGNEIQTSAKSLHSGSRKSCGCRGILVPSYGKMHARVRTERGKAATHPCVDCGEPAHDWSCSHEAELIRDDKGSYYSLNIMDYYPRCKRDHAIYDREFDAQL